MAYRQREKKWITDDIERVISYWISSGTLKSVRYYNKFGKPHSGENGEYPNMWWNSEGELEAVEYWYNGKMHRDSKVGPAIVDYRVNKGMPPGTLQEVMYMEHGKMHRFGAPAWLEYEEDGITLKVKGYYRHGEEVKLPEEWNEMDSESQKFTWELL